MSQYANVRKRLDEQRNQRRRTPPEHVVRELQRLKEEILKRKGQK
jgi:hypothetical protein